MIAAAFSRSRPPRSARETSGRGPPAPDPSEARPGGQCYHL
jgi:hypothetical protein